VKRKPLFGGADRSHPEAGGGRDSDGRLIRLAGISEQTFYRWKKQYIGLEVDQVRQLRQVQEENVRLKRLVAELILDQTMLQEVLAKKL
jgi:Transposase